LFAESGDPDVRLRGIQGFEANKFVVIDPMTEPAELRQISAIAMINIGRQVARLPRKDIRYGD
jgi:hypothetical protein